MTPILFPPERGHRVFDAATVAAWNEAHAVLGWSPGRMLHAIDHAGSPDRTTWVALHRRHREIAEDKAEDRLHEALRLGGTFKRGWFTQPADFVLTAVRG